MELILYTVGHRKSYEKYFSEQGIPYKSSGGSIWLTKEAAKSYLNSHGLNDFAVYGVLCGFENTEEIKEHDFRSLVEDSPLVKLL